MGLVELRQAIRSGQVEKAQGLLNKCEGEAALVEAALLDLLQFRLPEISELLPKSTDAATQTRFLILRGITLNRKRDPLGALAIFQKALQTAGKDPDLQIDVLLETAKAYVWLGNSSTAIDYLLQALSLAKQNPAQFLVFCRLADLYAELERWHLAQHYIRLARENSAGLTESIYYVQLLECEARTGLALGEDVSSTIGTLEKREAKLPAYLKFRLHVLLTEKEITARNPKTSTQAIARLQELPLCSNPESFEFTVAQVLSARIDLMLGNPNAAISKLTQVRDWYAEEDLAVRLIDAQILLAGAYTQTGQSNEAASELTAARNYCQSRGLNLQLERVESSFAAFNLALYPIIETKRISSTGWKNRQAYVILEKLGEGGQGSVFRAFDNARNKTVAFKKLKMKGPAALEALAREVRSANAAAVPNVARMIACGSDEDGSLYMVQEIVNGKSLRALFVSGEKPATLFNYLGAIAKTLSDIHAKGVVHGDVKPENIIITAAGEAILVDFGLAHIAAEKTLTQNGASARYAPPNFAKRFRKQEWRDTYALGVMLKESLGAGYGDDTAKNLAANLTKSIVLPFSKTDYSADWAKLLR